MEFIEENAIMTGQKYKNLKKDKPTSLNYDSCKEDVARCSQKVMVVRVTAVEATRRSQSLGMYWVGTTQRIS